jgi:hypothetical protein
LLDLENSSGNTFDNCWFSGANYNIKGWDTIPTTATVLSNCWFDKCITAHIHNIGQGWIIEGCAIEPSRDDFPLFSVNDVANPAMGLSFTGNWLGDVGSTGGSWIVINGTGICITGNYINGNGANNVTAVAVNAATSGLVVKGNRLSSLLTGVSMGSSILTDSDISANALVSVTNETTGTAGANVHTYKDNGTWTPGITFGGGVTGITYGTQTGAYTKIGKLVFVSWDIVLTSKGTDTGGATISGLPFTSSTLVNQAATIGYQQNMATTVTIYGRVESSNTAISLGTPSSTTMQNVVDTDFGNSTRISGSAVYTAA